MRQINVSIPQFTYPERVDMLVLGARSVCTEPVQV